MLCQVPNCVRPRWVKPVRHERSNKVLQITALAGIEPGQEPGKRIASPRCPLFPDTTAAVVEAHWERRCDPTTERERQRCLESEENVSRLRPREAAEVGLRQFSNMGHRQACAGAKRWRQAQQVTSTVKGHGPWPSYKHDAV